MSGCYGLRNSSVRLGDWLYSVAIYSLILEVTNSAQRGRVRLHAAGIAANHHRSGGRCIE